MEIGDTIKKILQELILPELETIKGENAEIKTTLVLTNKRLDDINAHLIDQSRRIDEVNKRIDVLKDEINGRIDVLRDDVNKRIDEVNGRIDGLKDDVNKRIDKLYDVILHRDEYGKKLEMRIIAIEHEIEQIKIELPEKMAA